MVAVTATWEIPYAQSFDPFCDGAAITQAMAERVDALLDTQDGALALLQRPAYASISVTVAADTEGFRIHYDTTDEDTANLVDLSLDPFSIYPNSTGIWFAGDMAATTTIALGATETWNTGVHFDAQVAGQDQTIREETGFRSVSSISTGVVYDPADPDYRLDTNMIGSGAMLVCSVYKARFWAWRYSDLP